MPKFLFQWNDGNRRHVIQAYPERANSQEEVESLFDDPNLLAAPDLKHSDQEERFNAVARSNENRILFVVYVVRNGYIRPISCRPASKEERNNYVQISQQTKSEASNQTEGLDDEE